MSTSPTTPEKKKTIQIVDLQGNRTEEEVIVKDQKQDDYEN